MKEKTITLCMIVRNEESHIKECLESAALYVDEIIVVDTGSTDNTCHVIHSSSAGKKTRVFHPIWNDDFAEARNISLSHATGDWILILDADERIADEDWTRLRYYTKTVEIMGHCMTTRNYGLLKNMPGWTSCVGEYPGLETGYPGWYPTSKVRLFPNRKGILFQYRVHELVEEAILSQGGHIRPCRIAVHHIAAQETSENLKKEEYYLSLIRKKMDEFPGDPLPYFEAGVISYGLRRLSEADKYFRLSLEALRMRSAVYLKPETVLWKIGVVAADMGIPDEAATYYEKALQENPECIEALNNWGVLLEKYNRYNEAMDKYQRALSADPNNSLIKDNMERVKKRLTRPIARLSLCMIVKNEEKNIVPCIEGIRDIVDEIIIVDTGSNDATPELAAKVGAKVFSYPWSDNFSTARNESIKHATGDYILWLDADDRLKPEEADKLRQLKKMLPPEGNKAYLLRLVNMRGNVVLDESWQLRIFPNREGIIFQNRIHETVFPSLDRLGIEHIKADIRILHTGYSSDDVCRSKAQRNITLMQEELKDDPMNFMIWYLLGGAYALINDYPAALSSYLKVARESGWDKTNIPVYANTLLQIGKAHYALKRYDEALKSYYQSLEHLPNDAMVWFAIGESLFAEGKYAEAYNAFERVRDENINLSVYITPTFKLRYLTQYYTGRCLLELGNIELSVETLHKALEIYPEFIEAMKILSSIYLRQGEWNKAGEFLKKVILLEQNDPAVLSNLALVYSKCGKAAEAEKFYREALEIDPNCIEALINLGHLYFNTGKYEQAKKTMEEVVNINRPTLDAWLVLARIYVETYEMDPFIQASDQIVRLMGLNHFHIQSFEDLSKVYIEIGESLLREGKTSFARTACEIAEWMLKYHHYENGVNR